MTALDDLLQARRHMKHTKRDVLTIMAEMLESAIEPKIKYRLREKYVRILVERGFLSFDSKDRTYVITEKGYQFLKILK